MKTNKVVLDFNTIKKLVTLSPDLTVLEAMELIKKLGVNMIDGNFPAILKETSEWTEKRHMFNNNTIEDKAKNRPNEVLYDGYGEKSGAEVIGIIDGLNEFYYFLGYK